VKVHHSSGLPRDRRAARCWTSLRKRKGDARAAHSSTTPELRFTLNGAQTEVEVDAGVSLLDLLRERLDLGDQEGGATRARAVSAPSWSTVRACATAIESYGSCDRSRGTAEEVRRRL
jgi:hypothetical protein